MRQCSHWGKKLRNCGFRVTVAREAILKLLSETEEHLGAEDIYLKVHQEHPAIGLTTVYRTLEILEQMKIVTRFDFNSSGAKFELSEAHSHKPHHHHLICRKCGKITDYSDFLEDESKYIQKTETSLKERYGYQIDGHLIRFYGLCPHCQD